MITTFMHVFDNRYASRVTLNIQRSTHPQDHTPYKVNKVCDQKY